MLIDQIAVFVTETGPGGNLLTLSSDYAVKGPCGIVDVDPPRKPTVLAKGGSRMAKRFMLADCRPMTEGP